jgi:hypothetical protein
MRPSGSPAWRLKASIATRPPRLARRQHRALAERVQALGQRVDGPSGASNRLE